MKLIPIIISIVVLTACGGKKEVADNTNGGNDSNTTTTEVAATDAADENVAPQENIAYGTVRITDTGCKVYIDTKHADRDAKMYPVNLEDKFKKDGLRIKFGWDMSRAPLPGGCDANMTVTVKDVTPYRGN